MTLIPHWQLRARFAQELSDLYGREVPAYTTLVEVAQEVNRDFQAKHPLTAGRLGSIERVTAERHGAIRVGSPTELAQVARLFGAVGMEAVGFYDLRDAKPNPIPVISTAFRPVDRRQLEKNPFRVFTSVLVPEDRRFFTQQMEAELKAFISARTLFSDEVLDLADKSRKEGGLSPEQSEIFIELATSAFALSQEPVDRAWYEELNAISSVAADIGGVASTHINHLTPRVLDIDELYDRMGARGIQMIDAIQGPPRWHGVDVLLRQTSFRALAEPRAFRERDGSISTGDLRVRFGEVEARGIALTPTGRDHYDRMIGEIDAREQAGNEPRAEIAVKVWQEMCAETERELLEKDFAFFNFAAEPAQGVPQTSELLQLIDGGWITAHPIVYEDFLPRSAAGIFASNLTGDGSVDASQETETRDIAWLSLTVGGQIHDPYDLYALERRESFEASCRALGLDPRTVVTPWAAH